MIETTVLDASMGQAPSITFGRRPVVRGSASQGWSGGDHDPWNQNWNPIARTADAELYAYLPYLWARSYEQHRNNILVSGPTDVLAEAVGEIIPTSLAKDPETRQLLTDAWRSWSEQSGSDGVATWGEICESIVGNACMGGDVGIMFEERPDLDQDMPLRLNLIDAWRIRNPMGFSSDKEQVNFGVATVKGMEVAYYVSKDPKDLTAGRDGYYRFDRIRGGRENFLLFRRPDATRRTGQSRAVPVISPALGEFKDLHEFRRSHLRGAGKRAKVTTVIESPDPQATLRLFDTIKTKQDSDPDLAAALRKAASPTYTSTPDAATLTVPYGTKFVPMPVETADPNFPQQIQAYAGILSTCWRLPKVVAYEIWEETNFSQARILTLRKHKTAKRWRNKIAQGPGRVAWKLMVAYLYAQGKIRDLTPDLYDVRWHGGAEDFMDFKSEVSASAEARSSRVLSPQEIGRMSGRDAFQMEDEQIEMAVYHKQKLAENGLTESDMSFLVASKTNTPTSISDPTNDGAGNKENDK